MISIEAMHVATNRDLQCTKKHDAVENGGEKIEVSTVTVGSHAAYKLIIPLA